MTLRTTNALLAVIAVCLVWLCISPSLPRAIAQVPTSPPPQRVFIVGVAAPRGLPVDIVSFANGQSTTLPVKVAGSSGALPVRLSAVDNQVNVPVTVTNPVTLKDVAPKDGALPVRVTTAK